MVCSSGTSFPAGGGGRYDVAIMGGCCFLVAVPLPCESPCHGKQVGLGATRNIGEQRGSGANSSLQVNMSIKLVPSLVIVTVI